MMSPHDEGAELLLLGGGGGGPAAGRWKCGEIYTWNNNADLYAVECSLCDDKILCTLSEFAEHMQAWHRCWDYVSDDDNNYNNNNNEDTATDDIDKNDFDVDPQEEEEAPPLEAKTTHDSCQAQTALAIEWMLVEEVEEEEEEEEEDHQQQPREREREATSVSQAEQTLPSGRDDDEEDEEGDGDVDVTEENEGEEEEEQFVGGEEEDESTTSKSAPDELEHRGEMMDDEEDGEEVVDEEETTIVFAEAAATPIPEPDPDAEAEDDADDDKAQGGLSSDGTWRLHVASVETADCARNDSFSSATTAAPTSDTMTAAAAATATAATTSLTSALFDQLETQLSPELEEGQELVPFEEVYIEHQAEPELPLDVLDTEEEGEEEEEEAAEDGEEEDEGEKQATAEKMAEEVDGDDGAGSVAKEAAGDRRQEAAEQKTTVESEPEAEAEKTSVTQTGEETAELSAFREENVSLMSPSELWRYGENLPPQCSRITSEQMLELIALYERHPRLWNTSHKEFSESDLCRESWEEIAKQFNAKFNRSLPTYELKLRISNLCQRYIGERQRQSDEMGADKADSRFLHFYAMRFLDKQPNAMENRRRIYYKQNVKLLEIYQKFPVLWHSALKHKPSPAKRWRALEDISEALKQSHIHLSSRTVQRRLHALHKYYRKEKANYILCRRQKTTFRTNFKHYQHMQFLDKHMPPYVCGQCDEVFEKLGEYKHHIDVARHPEKDHDVVEKIQLTAESQQQLNSSHGERDEQQVENNENQEVENRKDKPAEQMGEMQRAPTEQLCMVDSTSGEKVPTAPDSNKNAIEAAEPPLVPPHLDVIEATGHDVHQSPGDQTSEAHLAKLNEEKLSNELEVDNFLAKILEKESFENMSVDIMPNGNIVQSVPSENLLQTGHCEQILTELNKVHYVNEIALKENVTIYVPQYNMNTQPNALNGVPQMSINTALDIHNITTLPSSVHHLASHNQLGNHNNLTMVQQNVNSTETENLVSSTNGVDALSPGMTISTDLLVSPPPLGLELVAYTQNHSQHSLDPNQFATISDPSSDSMPSSMDSFQSTLSGSRPTQMADMSSPSYIMNISNNSISFSHYPLNGATQSIGGLSGGQAVDYLSAPQSLNIPQQPGHITQDALHMPQSHLNGANVGMNGSPYATRSALRRSVLLRPQYETHDGVKSFMECGVPASSLDPFHCPPNPRHCSPNPSHGPPNPSNYPPNASLCPPNPPHCMPTTSQGALGSSASPGTGAESAVNSSPSQFIMTSPQYGMTAPQFSMSFPENSLHFPQESMTVAEKPIDFLTPQQAAAIISPQNALGVVNQVTLPDHTPMEVTEESQGGATEEPGNGETPTATPNPTPNPMPVPTPEAMDVSAGQDNEPSTSAPVAKKRRGRKPKPKTDVKPEPIKRSRRHVVPVVYTDHDHDDDYDDDKDESSQDSMAFDDGNESSASNYTPSSSFNSSRLNEKQTHRLISLYKDQPVLWNPFHKDFESRKMRRAAWKAIASGINNVYNLRFAWQTIYKKLSDSVKYYRKEKERVASQDVRSKWYYFRDFSFLDEFLDITSDTHKTIQEREINLKIIDIYKEYPQLWNTHLQEYKKRSQRNRHIEAMHKSLLEKSKIQMPLGKLKRRLLEFRCNYRQEKEKRIECARNNEAFESFYEYYKDLEFLEDHISPFLCKVCGDSFTKLTDLMRHFRVTKHQKIIKRRTMKAPTIVSENDLKYICHICGTKFTMRNNLLYHLNRHNGKRTHMCSMCPKSFYNSTALRVHERSHTKEYPYVCEECGQAFVNNSKLNQHRKRHRNQRDFACDTCGKAFFSAFERDKHVKRHLNIRDQFCPICGKAFVVGSSIYTHMELHSDVKKYVCKICDKRFAQNSGLYRHMKQHHVLDEDGK